MFLPPFNESVVLSVHKVYLLTILCWPNDGFTSQLYHLLSHLKSPIFLTSGMGTTKSTMLLYSSPGDQLSRLSQPFALCKTNWFS